LELAKTQHFSVRIACPIGRIRFNPNRQYPLVMRCLPLKISNHRWIGYASHNASARLMIHASCQH
jgi:hypothetical protein